MSVAVLGISLIDRPINIETNTIARLLLSYFGVMAVTEEWTKQRLGWAFVAPPVPWNRPLGSREGMAG
ncbi:hypothetical protein [Nocardia sp. CY41]|uniref:hypothetical protein n=1 Tax=Nocardia sp. CY41 TaxID=2608686 RepID=UPI00135B46A6|nr:hypothetical protein [Nocardia sp. CY41]